MWNLQLHQYLCFKEEQHYTGPFMSSSDKFHFFERLSLSFSICMLSYCLVGSLGKILYLCKVSDYMTTSEIIKSSLFILDPDHLIDMRHANPGRPNDKFNDFFEKLNSKIQEFVTVDDRRHGTICHLSKYISIPDLIKDITEELPENSQVASESTCFIQIYAVQYREETAFFCVDDKCKIDFGEPGQYIQTGVPVKKAFIPADTTLAVLDRDQQSKGSLTSSVCLQVVSPTDINGSFYRGNVTVCYKDSVYEASPPFRHGIEVDKILRKSEIKPVLIIYSCGGPDHRLTYHSVKLALIVLFKKLNLDTLIAVRTAPGHSWLNPAEIVMSIFNLAIQNCALTRTETGSNFEEVLKSANSMSEIRTKATKCPGLKEAWIESVKAVTEILENRTSRLTLKEKPFTVEKAATAEDVEDFESQIQQVFDAAKQKEKYQQQHLKSKEDYQKFLNIHCKEKHYMFQVKKCDVENCCSPRVSETVFPWLPDPMMKGDDKDHYKPFNVVVDTATVDGRPSAQVHKAKDVAEQQQGIRNQGLIAQNVRKVVNCFECNKPRCVYNKRLLSVRAARAFSRLIEKHDYSCGSLITPEGDALEGTVTVRLQITCETPVEYSFYASILGRQDICALCGGSGAQKDEDLCKK
ncbi:unnamed protein product [Mytilus coruscus]|uniref:Uncharacterized protein n=1 Tax=Mytilus coruscus TaxID=42192 RepID=A0A6J8ETJ9_MYTCO|nr:unnamed protein product [Mytilus coruscus]